MLRSDPARTKSFISRRVGRFRWSYDLAVREYPRQNVFVGTVNDQNWNRDPTGNRRFWPMWCTYVDVDALHQVRDQIWAEALEKYNLGDNWWIDDQSLVVEARDAQEQRFVADPWEDRIRQELERRIENHHDKGDLVFKSSATMEQLLNILGIPFDRRSIREQMRVANILQRAGWTRRQVSFDQKGNPITSGNTAIKTFKRSWRYVPPGYDPLNHQIPSKK